MPIAPITRKRDIIAAVIAVVVCLVWLIWHVRDRSHAPQSSSTTTLSPATPAKPNDDLNPTTVYAHNLILRKGPVFRIYIRWLRGQMLRTHPNVTPSLDDPESFVFLIQKGVIHANVGDIANYFNTAAPANFPLKNITITGEGDQLKISGTLHKVIPFPVE